MSTTSLLQFIQETSPDKYQALAEAARVSGLEAPKQFGGSENNISASSQTGDKAQTRIEILDEALASAVSGYDKVEMTIRKRLAIRNRIKLVLNILTAVTATSVIATLDKDAAPWNYLLAGSTLVTAVLGVLVDHFGISAQDFWDKLGEAAQLREKTDTMKLRLKLASEDELEQMTESALESIEKLKGMARELDIISLISSDN